MGFLDDMTKNAALWSAVQASKDLNGKPDPFKAAGIVAGTGKFSFSDMATLGAILGSEGAFDDDSGIGSYGGECGGTDEYAWREFCEDGSEYGIAPEDYEDEYEYEEALKEAQNAWRDKCEDGFEYGIDAEEYETKEEYEDALLEVKEHEEAETDPQKDFALGGGSDNEIISLANYLVENEDNVSIPLSLKVSVGKRKDRKTQSDIGLQQKRFQRPQVTEEMLNDKTIYHYCGVVFEDKMKTYNYKTDDTSLRIGDKVIVPVGPKNEEVVAEIVSVEQHTRLSVPYPVERVKTIISKYE